MDYDKVTVRISPASEGDGHEFVISGQAGHYGFRDVIRLVATKKAGSDFLSADVAVQFLVTLRRTIIASLGCNITRYVSENDLPYYQIAKSSKPQHRILLDSSRYDQHQKLAPVVKSFGRRKNLESSNSLMQKILHYASSEFTLAFGAWKGEFNDGSLDIHLLVQSDLYDLRTTQFVKQNRRRAWAFERTITRKMEQDLAQRVRGPLKRYKGVRWRPERKHPWVAELKISEKRKLWIGDFDTPEEAAQAFDVAVISHKKKTPLNFKDSLVRTSEVVEKLPSPSNKPFDITYDDAPPINVASIFHRRKRFVNQLEASTIHEFRPLDQLSSCGQTFAITHDDAESTSNTRDPLKVVPSKSLKGPFLAEHRAHTKCAGVHHNEPVSAVSFLTSNLEASNSMLESSSLVQLSAFEESEPLDSRSYDNVGAIPHRKEMMTAHWKNSSLNIPYNFWEQLLGEVSDASTTSDMFFESLGNPRVAELSCGQLLNTTHDDEVAAVCHKQGTISHVDEDPPISIPSKSSKPPFSAEQCSDVKFAGSYDNGLQAAISCVTSNLDGSETSSWVQVSAYEEEPMERQLGTSKKVWGEANDMCFDMFGDVRVADSSGEHLDFTHDDDVAALHHRQGTPSNVVDDPPILVPSKSLKPPFSADRHSEVKSEGVHNELEAAISFSTSRLECGEEEPLDSSRSYGNVGSISHRNETMTVNWENSSPSVVPSAALSKQPLDIASDIMCFDMLGDPRVAGSGVTHYNSSNEDTSSSTMPGWPVHDNLFDSLEYHGIFLDPNDFIQADTGGIHEDERTAMLWMPPIASPDVSHNTTQGSFAPFQG